MSTDVKPSVHNPFRSHPVTPEPTGIGPSASSAVISGPGSQSVVPPRLDSESHQTGMASSATSGDLAQGRTRSPARQDRPSADDLAAELQSTLLEDNTPSEPPPAYTPSANPYEGEATVEYGPRRPFQPARPAPSASEVSGPSGVGIPLQRHNTSGPQASPFMSPQATGMSSISNRSGLRNTYIDRGPPNARSVVQHGPPPRHPQVAGSSQAAPGISNNVVRPTPTGVSEFARDFYASGSARPPSPVPSNASSDEVTVPEHFERERRTSAPSTRFSPPQGPPPTTSPSSPTSSYAPPSEPPPSRVSSDTSDDLRPTTTPTPGRPLLNKGRVLVYPNGFQCKKCLNTGYKSFDPSHPCRKCWDKHSKPYSGAIVYAPHSSQSQRPLPNLKPPQSQPHSSLQPPHASSAPNLLRSQSAHRPTSSSWGGYPGRLASRPCMGSGSCGRGPALFTPSLPPRPVATPQLNFTRGLPPPGSVVVQPGDPRIGGRLCWRCDGTGTVSFLIFDIEQCPICNGVGRVFQ